MAIPVGLMSPNARMDRRVDGNPDQGYWQGDRFIFPKYKSPPMAPPMVPSGPMDAVVPPMAMPSQPSLPPIIGGDGPQGEFGGREATDTTNQNVDVQGMMDQGIPAGYGQPQTGLQPAGLGVTNAAPATAVAPAVTDLAVSEVDPQGPPGSSKGGSKGSKSDKPDPATFSEQSKSLAAQVAQDLKGFAVPDMKDFQVFNDLADITKGWAPTVTVDANPYGGNSDPEGPAGAGSHGNATNPGQDALGGIGAGSTEPGGSAAGGGGIGGDTGGGAGVGPGGVGGPGDPAGSPGVGGWRAGGRTGNDGDKKKMEPRGLAHEDEFYFNPEMTGLMDRVAPGLLDRLDRFQKGLMAPRSRGRGLMG